MRAGFGKVTTTAVEVEEDEIRPNVRPSSPDARSGANDRSWYFRLQCPGLSDGRQNHLSELGFVASCQRLVNVRRRRPTPGLRARSSRHASAAVRRHAGGIPPVTGY